MLNSKLVPERSLWTQSAFVQTFLVAHEIGHYVLHPREGLDRDDTAKNFIIWNDSSEEAEANLFAQPDLEPRNH